MSAFGGDSWAREAQHRKRRVDLLMLESSSSSIDNNSSSKVNISTSTTYKRLSNGKYECLVCSSNPILDSPLMLSMHCKGSRHIAAESRLKERELAKQDELNKRIALSYESTASRRVCISGQQLPSTSKPLIERTRKVASEILHNQKYRQHDLKVHNHVIFKQKTFSSNSYTQPTTEHRLESSLDTSIGPDNLNTRWASSQAGKLLEEQHIELQKQREKELKFTAAGWKRDCHGKWFRDENVEFDSDEEDPNVVL